MHYPINPAPLLEEAMSYEITVTISNNIYTIHNHYLLIIQHFLSDRWDEVG